MIGIAVEIPTVVIFPNSPTLIGAVIEVVPVEIIAVSPGVYPIPGVVILPPVSLTQIFT